MSDPTTKFPETTTTLSIRLRPEQKARFIGMAKKTGLTQEEVLRAAMDSLESSPLYADLLVAAQGATNARKTILGSSE